MGGQHVEVHGGVEGLDVVDGAQEAHPGPLCFGHLGWGEPVGLVRLGPAGDDEPSLRVHRADPGHGLEELDVALLVDEATHGTDEHGVAVRVEVVAQGPRRGGVDAGGVEAVEVDAVAQQGELAAGYAEAGQRLEVLLVLDELGVRAGGGQSLEAVDARALGRTVVLGGEEAVLGVHDHRDAGGLGRDAAVDARLGVVGVDDVGLQVPEHPPQLGQRPHVGRQRPAPGGVVQAHVADAVGFELLDVRPGG